MHFIGLCCIISLRAGLSGDRIPVGAKFSTLVQTSPGTNPASYTMGTVSLSRGLSGRGVALNTHPTSAEAKERVGYTSTPPLGLCGLF